MFNGRVPLKIKHVSDYRKKRAEAYPDVAEQLDMLWHAMDSEPSLRVEPFYTALATIKKRYPKSK